jgi:hypothetical protein
VLSVELSGHGRVVGLGQLGKLEHVIGAADDCPPGVDLAAQALGLAQDLLRGALVRPEIRLGRLRVELLESVLLGG